jgi:mxaA protein
MRSARAKDIHLVTAVTLMFLALLVLFTAARGPATPQHRAIQPPTRARPGVAFLASPLKANFPRAAASSCATQVPPQSRVTTAAVVQQPRLTGYFVGDLLTQRVLLQYDGQTLTPVTLPISGRVSAWFERRQATVVTDTALRRWLTIEYQILNAPPKLIDVTLPAWQLRVTSNAGGSPLTLSIPAVSINIAPLSLPGSPEQVGTHDLRLDRVPPPIPLEPLRRGIAIFSGALVLTLIAWLGWVIWRNRRAIATQPFARAWREMRTLDDREPRAWQALHRAFDRTAGHVIQSATLPTLFARAPQLSPARTQIEEFFAQSSQLFFGSPISGQGASARTASDPTAYLPRALCAELRRIERRHER